MLIVASIGFSAEAEHRSGKARTHIFLVNVQSEAIPQQLYGTWQRLVDSERVQIDATTKDLLVGAYRYESESGAAFILIRNADSLAAHAQAYVGLPVVPSLREDQLIPFAENYSGFTQQSFVISAWRQADGIDWPWVEHSFLFGGLAGLMRRYNIEATGFAFDSTHGAYVDGRGQVIRLQAASINSKNIPAPTRRNKNAQMPAVQLGDLIASVDAGKSEGIHALIVEDREPLGMLSPADQVICAQFGSGLGEQKIRQVALGQLMQQNAIFVYRRDALRIKGFAQQYKSDNPIWDLPAWRQYCALAGIFLVIVVLMRFGARRRRQQRQGRSFMKNWRRERDLRNEMSK